MKEAELLLSCDGGRRFARVADLAPSAVSRSWTVPNLPTRSAVLALRARIGGREVLLYRTAPFSIAAIPGLGLAPVTYHGGELWTDPAGGSTPVSDSGLDSSRPGAHCAFPGEDELDTDDSALDAPTLEPTSEIPDAPLAAPAPPLPFPGPLAPGVYPKRE